MAHLVALITDRKLAAELEPAAEAAGHDVDVCTGEADAWAELVGFVRPRDLEG